MKALEAAGAKVLAFQEFGSYQGDWWAKVEYQGKIVWVNGSYGSCSGCDAFLAEFGYNEKIEPNEGKFYRDNMWYDPEEEITEDEANIINSEWERRLADFGKSYLINVYSQRRAEIKASENLEWDSEAEEMLMYIKNMA